MDSSTHTTRPKLFAICIIIGFLILCIRLFYLQIYLHKKYSTLAENNRFRIDPLQAVRGKILDRNGVILADNKNSYQLIYHHHPKENLNAQLPWLQKCLPHTTELQTIRNLSVISRRLSIKELSCLSHYQDAIPSFTLESRMIRYYPFGEATSHLLGYMAPPTAEQNALLSPTERKALYTMGRSGIENIYETSLRGHVGWDQREVNAKGRTIRYLDHIPSTPGEDVQLTIDSRLQQAAFDALKHHSGAIVALNPQDGSLLALASRPTYNANDFSYIISQKLYQELLEDTNKPLYHRATQGLYPHASIIKPFYALAALEDNIVTATESIHDAGWFSLPHSSHIFHDWKRSGHGIVNLDRAITVSCDTYFYKLSLKMGIDRMASWLKKFGFGQSIGTPLTMRTGLVPTPEWKKQRKMTWQAGDTVITGIGQGAMLTTPLHAARAAAIMAMRGNNYALKITMTEPTTLVDTVDALASSYDTVIQAMVHVVSAVDGTAHPLHTLPFTLAAKTGTAQVVSLNNHTKKRHHDDHHWLIGFAPVEHPRIAFAILIEHQHVALQVASEFLQAWWALETARNDVIN